MSFGYADVWVSAISGCLRFRSVTATSGCLRFLLPLQRGDDVLRSRRYLQSLLLHQPDSLEIRVISGRKSAITMKPMMPPRMTIMIGSSRLTKLSTAVSTSSS